MTPELAAAVERLRKYRYGDTRIYAKRDEPHETDLDRVERDRHRVADAYIDQHSPDSDTLIDAEWLLACGGELVDHGLILFSNEYGVDLYWWSDGTVNFDDLEACTPINSRGDLRSLCRVLKIPLKETP